MYLRVTPAGFRVFAKAERRRFLSLCSLGVRPERFLRMAGIEPTGLAVSQWYARTPPYFFVRPGGVSGEATGGDAWTSAIVPFQILIPFRSQSWKRFSLLPATERLATKP